ncbi:MAG TPA: type II toxin-antitoxin system RelE/ParE family toxin [Candidatus Acidoferrum sp.]|nr:type II toxin-antitoxin system RelE/ParE family toxin [Candidatus Acidoferrum sp.]
MSHYRVSEAANRDLQEIWLFIAQDNQDSADRYIRLIVSRFPKLASMPQMGRERRDLAARLRSFPVGSYVIFYRPTEDGIEVVRVIHGARDLPPLFG